MVSTKELLNNLRKEYASAELLKSKMATDPIDQFGIWFEEALKAEVSDINVMALATATKAGAPSCRTVLIKDYSSRGITFYTNYESRKGRELAENPLAALNFFWPELGRQIVIEGNIEKVDEDISTEYFDSRPEDSKIGALASNQSAFLENRSILDNKAIELANEYQDKKIEKPHYWGGYLVIPYRVEFWQSRPNRLHDRLQYVLEDNGWGLSRLSP